jgi:hypothetical protein
MVEVYLHSPTRLNGEMLRVTLPYLNTDVEGLSLTWSISRPIQVLFLLKRNVYFVFLGQFLLINGI